MKDQRREGWKRLAAWIPHDRMAERPDSQRAIQLEAFDYRGFRQPGFWAEEGFDKPKDEVVRMTLVGDSWRA